MTEAVDPRVDAAGAGPGQDRTRGAWRVVGRALLWSVGLVYFAFIALVLALRYSVLPNIENYRGEIERLVSRGLGQAVSIGGIEASWQGINPDLTLSDVRIADTAGRPALAFSRVEAILSWWTVPSAQLKLRLLRIEKPTLNLRRDAEGRFFIAGIALNSDEASDGKASEWVLAQRRIRVSDATLVWDDALRQAPTLVLDHVDFALDNDGSRHRFGLTALPPEALASKIDVRGDLRGSELAEFDSWSGEAYTEIAYADLAIWRQWIDYPFAVPHGRGALRAWFQFADGRLNDVTADLALREVSLRLAKNLEPIDLNEMSGRLGLRVGTNGFALRGRQFALSSPRTSEEAIRIEPTDFDVEWQHEADGKTVVGSASVTAFDVGAIASIGERLPIDAKSRQLLKDYAPQGRVSGLAARWRGDADHMHSYTIKAGFDRLGLVAKGYFPGFSGVSGSFEANEKNGSANLRAGRSTIVVPSVFAEPAIELDSLAAQVKWTISDGQVLAEIAHAEFAGADAAGSAQGSYRSSAQGPGSIDMTAALERADARAVWRYMPRVVGEGARQWLRHSLLAGSASDAKLILKGDLANFPFVDKRLGQFLVTVKAHDVILDYGTGWPRIEGIEGDLRFEGRGMVVNARRGTILGAKLTNTRAEIPNFDLPVPMLHVKGLAEGATAEFLRFVEQSPVGERIDHFTADMRALGNGQLNLALSIPLDEDRLGDSTIDGRYRFTNNEVVVDDALPPLRQVNGSVQFTASDFRVPEVSATLFGGPVKIKGGPQKDGRIVITANGEINVAQLRRQSDFALLSHFSGATTYQGTVTINKRDTDLVIDSPLVGLASTLPAPFAKDADATLPLHFEREFLPGKAAEGGEPVVRDKISATLGKSAAAELIRRKQKDGFVVERGAIGVGRAPVLPESGVAVAVSAARVDLDAWRALAAVPAGGAGPAAGGTATPPVDTVSIKTPELVLLGRHFGDVELNATASAKAWKIRLASKQVNGDLVWDGAGSGKLTARLKQLTIDSSAGGKRPEVVEAVKELPALDVVADEFSVSGRRLGRLEVQARNEGGVWKLDRINAGYPYGTLVGNGRWQVGGGRNTTQLDFKLDAYDAGRLLDRLGYPGAVRGGSAQLEGKIGWNGAPTDLDYESLSGKMTLEAAKGQFLKLDPGAAGKLLGLISLQGLPRRIALDFKDVFSEGFSFDNIASTIEVNNGQMHTSRLQIDGPSARVVMSGEVDLRRETQRLFVSVQPELGGTAALGVALINPVAGVATWVAHKILQNPLNHMFGFKYLVTGTWDEPKVEKLSNTEAAPSPPKLPTIPNTPGDADGSGK